MNIQIEFIGFPTIYDLFPEGAHSYTFAGRTIGELVGDLIEKNNPRVRETLLDGKTQTLDSSIQVTINRQFIKKEELQSRGIQEGDRVIFMRLLAGG
ncbi:MAG: hypothetical protein NTY64_09065 [Deltaproteobacteria bacterium]|nr:hypothetical protein [Deltaproteobacteria bacterium]